MKRILLLFSVFSVYVSVAGPITLEECRQAAHDNYPAIRRYGLIEKSKELNLSNASRAWLPGVNVTGFGIGLTDVLEFNAVGNSLYGGALIINQKVYDGGAIKSRKAMIAAESEVESRETDVTIHDIDGRVEQIYFGILMLDEQLRQIGLLQDNLAIAENTVKSLMAGGLANQSDLDAVNVSQVQASQQEIELRSNRKVYLAMLSYFCPSIEALQGPEVILQIPKMIEPETGKSLTMALYDSKESVLDARKKALDVRIIPTVNAFAVGSYHNRLISTMYKGNVIGGGTVQWNIGAFYTRKNDLSLIDNSRNQLGVQRETFTFEKRLQQSQTNGRIESIRSQMELDDKTVTLRESILDKSRQKVENGTETVNEMLRNINELSSAKLQKSIHEVQLLSETYKLDNINAK